MFYWDGKDDQGRVLPPGMYSYVVYTKARGLGYEGTYGQRLYLFHDLWPAPKEVKNAPSRGGCPDHDGKAVTTL